MQPSPEQATPRLRPVDAPAASAMKLWQTLHRECDAMFRHALDQGKDIPPDLAQGIAQGLSAAPGTSESEAMTQLMVLHGELAALIHPARGRTLVLLEDERTAHPRLYVFGPVPLVRQMLGFAVFALAATSALSTFKNVDVDNVATGWFGLGGIDAYCVIAFMLAVAGLGTAFSNLSTINRYIERANYDPIFEGSYWVCVVLGLISGVVLGEILFDLVMKVNVTTVDGLAPAGERIMLAFLGGFAIARVQRLLTNLSDAIGTLLQGRNRAAARAQRPPHRCRNRSDES